MLYLRINHGAPIPINYCTIKSGTITCAGEQGVAAMNVDSVHGLTLMEIYVGNEYDSTNRINFHGNLTQNTIQSEGE